MIAKKLLEEQIYFPIVNQFTQSSVDFEMLGKIIVDVCAGLEAAGEDVADLQPRALVKNALLLILGLLHKDAPVDNYGKDIASLPPEDIDRVRMQIEAVFE